MCCSNLLSELTASCIDSSGNSEGTRVPGLARIIIGSCNSGGPFKLMFFSSSFSLNKGEQGTSKTQKLKGRRQREGTPPIARQQTSQSAEEPSGGFSTEALSWDSRGQVDALLWSPEVWRALTRVLQSLGRDPNVAVEDALPTFRTAVDHLTLTNRSV